MMRRFSKTLCRRALLPLSIAVAACSGGDGGPVAETPSIQLSVTPPSLSVQQSGSTSLTVSLTRGGGFDGVVRLSISGLPDGVSTRIAPTELSGSATTATVALNVAPTAPPGAHTATFTATAQGVAPATATASLTVTAVPNYVLRLTPAALTIAPGGSGESQVAIDRTSFDGAVALTLLNAPAGVSGVFTPATVTAGASMLVLSVAAGVQPGNYALTVQGSADGLGVKTAALVLTVPIPPSYTIGLSPASLTVQRGSGAVVSVTLARTSFTGAIDLALGTLPAGITGALIPSSTTGSSARLELQVAPGVPAGFYQLSVRGTAAGLVDRVAFLQVNVTETAPGGGNVEYQFCDASVVPVFFAYQDGTGAWQRVTGFTSGGTTTFAFNLTQGRGGALAVFRMEAPVPTGPALTSAAAGAPRRAGWPRPRSAMRGAPRARTVVGRSTERPLGASAADVYLTEVLYGTTSELARDGTDYCGLTQPTKTITGTVSGLAFGQYGIVSMGPSTELFIAGTSTNPVTFTNVPIGRVDLVATRMPVAGSPPDKVIVLRDLDVPDGGSLPAPIDFNGTAAVAPATATATITGGAGEDFEIFTELVSANSRGLLWFDLDPSPVATRPWAGIPASATESGDFHGVYAFATSAQSALDYRVRLEFVGAVADQTLGLGPVIAAPQATQVAAGEYPRFRFQGSFAAAYDKGASIDIFGAEGSGNTFSILATRAWLTASGGSTAYDFTMPDVAGLSGFPLASRLTAGANDVAAGAFGFTGSGVFDPAPAPLTEYRSASRGVSIAVP